MHSPNVSFESYEAEDVVCPACIQQSITVFYAVRAVPVHSCILIDTPEAAKNYPCREIKLGYCRSCGFVHNTVFDNSVHDYGSTYEETQGFSSVFNDFTNQLADKIIERFDLNGKSVMEIGCGKGEFLYKLCKLGGNKGVGIDPSYVPGRLPDDSPGYVTFIREFYQLCHGSLKPDFIFCRHTLEHIHQVRDFMELLVKSTGNRNVDVWFDLPDAHRVWQEGAFWDVYYEHASYFSPGTTARLFRASGFDVTELSREYGDQWISISGRKAEGTPITHDLENDLEQTARDIDVFRSRAMEKMNYWRNYLSSNKRSGGITVLWGGGSKAVAFITTLNVTDEVDMVVDINPYKVGRFLPVSGHPVVSPEMLKKYSHIRVIVMNPIYQNEIQQTLDKLGVMAELELCQ